MTTVIWTIGMIFKIRASLVTGSEELKVISDKNKLDGHWHYLWSIPFTPPPLSLSSSVKLSFTCKPVFLYSSSVCRSYFCHITPGGQLLQTQANNPLVSQHILLGNVPGRSVTPYAACDWLQAALSLLFLFEVLLMPLLLGPVFFGLMERASQACSLSLFGRTDSGWRLPSSQQNALRFGSRDGSTHLSWLWHRLHKHTHTHMKPYRMRSYAKHFPVSYKFRRFHHCYL